MIETLFSKQDVVEAIQDLHNHTVLAWQNSNKSQTLAQFFLESRRDLCVQFVRQIAEAEDPINEKVIEAAQVLVEALDE